MMHLPSLAAKWQMKQLMISSWLIMFRVCLW
jgi:hypothetical protein